MGSPKYGSPASVQVKRWAWTLRSFQPLFFRVLAWNRIQSSVPSGDWVNEQWPTPQTLALGWKTGASHFFQLAASRTLPPLYSSMPRQYSVVQLPLAE